MTNEYDLVMASGIGLSLWDKASSTPKISADLREIGDFSQRREVVLKELQRTQTFRNDHGWYRAELLWEARENKYYEPDYATFKEYAAEALGYPPSAAAQLASSYEIWVELCSVPEEVLHAINLSKAQITRSWVKQNPELWREAVEAMDDHTCEELREWVKEKLGKDKDPARPHISFDLTDDQADTWKEAKQVAAEDLSDPNMSPSFALQQICREYLASKSTERGVANMGIKLMDLIRQIEAAYHVKITVVAADPEVWHDLIGDNNGEAGDAEESEEAEGEPKAVEYLSEEPEPSEKLG